VRQLVQRIPVSFILHSMYAPYSISLNPFKSVLYTTFVKERELAIKVSAEGGFSEREQLVWVLWKILKGDGNDVNAILSYLFCLAHSRPDWSLFS
jgi:hypothetical protein